MLNSKDEYVQHLKEHFKAIGVSIELDDKRLIIRDRMLNGSVIFHIILGLLAIEYTLTLKSGLYMFPVACLYAIIGYVIFWVDFKSINIIEFDLLNKNILIRNRSIIRRFISAYMVPPPVKYYFEDCAAVEIAGNGKKDFFLAKYFVNIRLKTGNALELINFSEEVNALLFSKFVTLFIE